MYCSVCKNKCAAEVTRVPHVEESEFWGSVERYEVVELEVSSLCCAGVIYLDEELTDRLDPSDLDTTYFEEV